MQPEFAKPANPDEKMKQEIFSLGKRCEVVAEGQGILQKKGGTVGFLVVKEIK